MTLVAQIARRIPGFNVVVQERCDPLQARVHIRMIAGYWLSRAALNSAESSLAAALVGAVLIGRISLAIWLHFVEVGCQSRAMAAAASLLRSM
jgi:hypothetical protein